MHPNTHARRTRLWWGLTLAASFMAAVAQAQPPTLPPPPAEKDTGLGDARIDPRTGAVIVPPETIVRYDPKIPEIPTDILVSREGVITIRTDPNNLKILHLIGGKSPGVAQVTLLFKDRPRFVFEVRVETPPPPPPDYRELRALIQKAVPTANVDLTPGGSGVVILSGYATSPQDVDLIQRLAASQVGLNGVINAIQVGGVQQVQIDVVIASVNRSEIRNRGFDFIVNGQTAVFNSIVSSLIAPTSGSLGGGTTSFTVSPTANLQFGLAPAGLFTALQALRTESLAKFLGEPRVVTQTGRPAFFRSGGQQAILSATSGITGPGVQLVPFGTELEVLPIVYGNGQIWLEINPRVTAVNAALGITVNGANSPGFTEQQVRCAVMLESGQTFAIGGLIQNTVQTSATKVPVLGDLPYVGTIFSSISHSSIETELVILVTPRLVHAMDCNQVPKRLPGRETRNPDDYELFLENILEAPRGQRKVWNGRCYNAAYKCDPTIATFPCAGNVCYGPNGTPLATGACGPSGSALPVRGMSAAATPVNGMSAPTVATRPMPAQAAKEASQGMPVQASQAIPVEAAAQLPISQASPMQPAPQLPLTVPTVPGVPVGATPESGSTAPIPPGVPSAGDGLPQPPPAPPGATAPATPPESPPK